VVITHSSQHIFEKNAIVEEQLLQSKMRRLRHAALRVSARNQNKDLECL